MKLVWPWRPKRNEDSANTVTGSTIVTIECIDKSACEARERLMVAMQKENEVLRKLNEPKESS